MTRFARGIVLCLCAAALFGLAASPASAALSAAEGFRLIRRIPPGEDLAAAAKFLGAHTSERTLDAKAGVKVRRWGGEGDSWFLDALHDGKEVKATRVTWTARSVGDQQSLFAQLTTAGKDAFGIRGRFVGSNEVRWTGFEGRWLVVGRYGSSVTEGTTLLSGIRSGAFDSGRYGF